MKGRKSDFALGNVIGALNQRRGTIIDTEVRDDEFTITAEVSLNDMFGCKFYSDIACICNDRLLAISRLFTTTRHDTSML